MNLFSCTRACLRTGWLALLTLAIGGCGPLAPDRYLYRYEVAVEESLVRLAETSGSALALVVETESWTSVASVVCFQELLFSRPQHREFLPHSGAINEGGGSADEGCDPPYEARAELRTLPGHSNCEGLNVDEIDGFDELELGTTLATTSAVADQEDIVCFNQAVEAYGTPLLGPLDVPPPVHMELDESSVVE